MARVLYENPLDEPGTVTSHVHALRLAPGTSSPAAVTPETVVGVDHLLGTSEILSGTLDLYVVGEIRAMEPIVARSAAP